MRFWHQRARPSRPPAATGGPPSVKGCASDGRGRRGGAQEGMPARVAASLRPHLPSQQPDGRHPPPSQHPSCHGGDGKGGREVGRGRGRVMSQAGHTTAVGGGGRGGASRHRGGRACGGGAGGGSGVRAHAEAAPLEDVAQAARKSVTACTQHPPWVPAPLARARRWRRLPMSTWAAGEVAEGGGHPRHAWRPCGLIPGLAPAPPPTRGAAATCERSGIRGGRRKSARARPPLNLAHAARAQQAPRNTSRRPKP